MEMKSRVKGRMFSVLKVLVGMVCGFFVGYILADIFTPGDKKLPPYIGFVMMALFGGGVIYYVWKRTRALAQIRDEEESIQGRRLGLRFIYFRVIEIVVMSWFVCSVISFYRVHTNGMDVLFGGVNVALATLCLILITWLGLTMKKRYNTLYPEQSVTYSQSMEMWAKNADEGQKHIVHEAGYKAYQYTNMTLACAWFAAIAYTLLDGTDFFIITLISFVWILHIGTYMYEMHKKMIY
ncbi:DUF3169 family protein [Bacillus gaemokensis]|uniref:DUF3169 domain-containing protein n=1 Tax=Bacillus gaemokensis TaxID=574375 RepID=A0A073KFQ6_9BACI|nr:DUF3169 family protein [Bacillus gaemokensis]KEK25277.1 hypothetical protein BAGA_11650 [Bacillus gaemokensis]KYG37280.1 hypothetical protein AZF08_07695 [Bacillus gaemokensis]